MTESESESDGAESDGTDTDADSDAGTDPPRDIAIPVPPDYTEAERAAYLTGCRVIVDLFGNAAETYRSILAGEAVDAAVPDADAGGGDDGDDDGPDECPQCGAALLASMGAPEDVTPAGTVCPACEL